LLEFFNTVYIFPSSCTESHISAFFPAYNAPFSKLLSFDSLSVKYKSYSSATDDISVLNFASPAFPIIPLSPVNVAIVTPC